MRQVLPPNHVWTPFGPRDRAHVHYVPPGHVVHHDDGMLTVRHKTTGHVRQRIPLDTPLAQPRRSQDIRAILRPDVAPNPAKAVAGWINLTGTPISSFSTTWTVPPPPPAAADGQLVYIWPGLLDEPITLVLQPVLQWGGATAGSVASGAVDGNPGAWGITSWFVTADQLTVLHATLVPVSPGDVLVGLMTGTGGAFDYDCEFVGQPSTLLSMSGLPELRWAIQELESYYVNGAEAYPDRPSVAMESIEIVTGATHPDLSEDGNPWLIFDGLPDGLNNQLGEHAVVESDANPDGRISLFYGYPFMSSLKHPAISGDGLWVPSDQELQSWTDDHFGLSGYENPCAIEGPLYIATCRAEDDILRVAQVPLNDPTAYLGGAKDARLIALSAIQRVSSDWLTGNFPAQSVSLTFADTDHHVRSF